MDEWTMKNAVVHRPPLARQYGDELLVMESGKGCRIQDVSGKSYLDMGAGIAVNALGYGREDLAEIAAAQMKKIIHVSNLFASRPQLELAEKMAASPMPGRPGESFEAVHFGNSGAEANESAMKYARLYSLTHKGEGHFRFISFSSSFHGRTMGSLSITANPAYRKPFEPLIPGCDIIPFNDTEALEKTISAETAAVIVEPVQGEGGLNVVSAEFAQALNTLCRRHNCLLIADEVQTGMGRCGTFFASELTGLQPDMITLAKPLAGGLPLSAVLIPEKINSLLKPGHHATTFGGGPVTTAVALAVWDILSAPDFLEETQRKGRLLEDLLAGALRKQNIAGEIRGAGLLRGLRLSGSSYDGAWCSKVLTACRERGLILLKTEADVLRLAPPLVISSKEIKEGVEILSEVIYQNL